MRKVKFKKYWIDEWPEPVASNEYDKEVEQEKTSDKIHYELLLAFNGNCEINNKVYSNDELKKYASECFTIGQKIEVNNNYDSYENTYTGVLLELVERPAGIYGNILED